MTSTKVAACFLICIFWLGKSIEKDKFHPGPVIPDFGAVASVESDIRIDEASKFMVCFDCGKGSPKQSINQTFDSVARFINLNVECGADQDNIEIAIVVHGSAAMDVTTDEFFSSKSKDGVVNPNVNAIKLLQKHRVTFYVCGQSAAWSGIEKSDLIQGVQVAPSAMTAHAILQQKGFTLNPF